MTVETKFNYGDSIYIVFLTMQGWTYRNDTIISVVIVSDSTGLHESYVLASNPGLLNEVDNMFASEEDALNELKNRQK